jgi:hypothetical protein
MRALILAALFAAAAVLVVVGAAMVARPAGFIVGGVLLAGWSWLVFGEVAE